MVKFLSLLNWMLQQQPSQETVDSKRSSGQLFVHGQWRDAKIVDFGPPIKIVLKGELGCILVDQKEFDTLWRFERSSA